MKHDDLARNLYSYFRVQVIFHVHIACKRPLCSVNVTTMSFINYVNNAYRCSDGYEAAIISDRIEPSAKVQYFTEMATDR